MSVTLESTTRSINLLSALEQYEARVIFGSRSGELVWVLSQPNQDGLLLVQYIIGTTDQGLVHQDLISEFN